MVQPLSTAHAIDERAAPTSHFVLELAISTASLEKCRTLGVESLLILVRLYELRVRRILTFAVGVKDSFVK